jgi:serine/threonine-protein kinase RsbW
MSSAPDPVVWSWPAEVSSVSTARTTVVDWLREHGARDPALADVALAAGACARVPTRRASATAWR